MFITIRTKFPPKHPRSPSRAPPQPPFRPRPAAARPPPLSPLFALPPPALRTREDAQRCCGPAPGINSVDTLLTRSAAHPPRSESSPLAVCQASPSRLSPPSLSLLSFASAFSVAFETPGREAARTYMSAKPVPGPPLRVASPLRRRLCSLLPSP